MPRSKVWDRAIVCLSMAQDDPKPSHAAPKVGMLNKEERERMRQRALAEMDKSNGAGKAMMAEKAAAKPRSKGGRFKSHVIEEITDVPGAKQAFFAKSKNAILPYLQKANLAIFAADFLTGPKDPPFSGKFIIGDFHVKIADLLNQHKKLCILAPRGHGKCGCAGTLVTRPDGSRVPVEKWTGGEVLAYNDKTHQLEIDYAAASVELPKEACVRVTTRTGRQVSVNMEHRFKKLNEWVYPKDLRVGDRIAVPKKLTCVKATGRVPDAWALGLLVGDGSLTQIMVSVTSADPDVVNKLYEIYSVGNTEGSIQYRLHKQRARMEEVGLIGKGAYEKRVPDCIFTACNEDIATFLSGYLDADAHVNMHGGGSVEYYSVSKALLQDVQHLLTRLGVVSVLTPKLGKYKGEDHHSWRLTIRSKSVVRMAEVLNPVGSRRHQLQTLAAVMDDGNDAGAMVDLLPQEAHTLIRHSEDWFRRNDHPRPNRSYEMTRTKARNIAIAEDNNELRQLAEADILWDQVTSIEDIGDQHCYTISVDRLENYVANDIINHNSYLMTVAYPIWKAMQLEGRKSGIIFSGTQRQAETFLGMIKDEIEKNPKLQHLKPANPKKWAQQSITLTTGLTITALGYGVRARGAHPDFIVVDDGLNDEDAYSELVREKNIDYFHSAIENMIMPDGQIVVVGTPFHQEDLYAMLRKNPEFYFTKFQALLDEGQATERALWPEVFSLDYIRRNRASIGEIRFARERMCIPMSSAASLFPDDLFVGPEIENYTACLGLSRAAWDRAGIQQVFMGVDFSLSANVGSDWNAVFVLGIDGLGRRHVMDIFHGHQLSYQAQFSNIVTIARKYAPDIIYVESNQAQRIWADELHRLTDLPIKMFFTTSEKHSLEKGIPSLRIPMENGKVRIPRGDAKSVELVDKWRAELQGMTMIDGRVVSTGKHDDLVMAYWIANCAANDTRFSFAFGMQDGDQEAFDEELRKEAELFQVAHNSIPHAGGEAIAGMGLLLDNEEHVQHLKLERADMQLVDQNRNHLPRSQRPPTFNELGISDRPLPMSQIGYNNGGYFPK